MNQSRALQYVNQLSEKGGLKEATRRRQSSARSALEAEHAKPQMAWRALAAYKGKPHPTQRKRPLPDIHELDPPNGGSGSSQNELRSTGTQS